MSDRYSPMKTGRFSVEIDSVNVPGWRLINLPGSSTEQEQYREDTDYQKQVWGQTSFDEIEMERALAANDSLLFDWREAIREGRVDTARKTVAVTLLNEEGQSKIRWTFSGAWIKEYDPPTLDATADGAAIESILLAFGDMQREYL